MGFRCTISSVIFLMILSSIQTRFMAEGRTLLKKDESFQRVYEENKVRLRARMGSRPPHCEGRCSSCGPCQAIQVPSNLFRAKSGKRNSSSVVSTFAAYGRGNEYASNYKPMSWRCKCGTIIFSP